MPCLGVVTVNDIQKYNKVVNYEDFLSDKIPERRFRIVYPNREVFYLTQGERDFLLTQVNRGQRYIQIGEHTFTSSFIALYPIKQNVYKKEYVEVKNEDGSVTYREK